MDEPVIVVEPAATPLPALPVEQRPSQDPYEVYLASLDSPESRRTMRGVLDRIARMQTGDPDATGAWQPWWLLRYEHTALIRSQIKDYRDADCPNGYSPSHVNKHLHGLRRVLYTCWQMGLMSVEDREMACSIKNVKGTRVPAGRSINRDELAAMLKVCAETDGPAGIRDSAIIALLYATGIRRAEAATAQVEDYDIGARRLKVTGKGDKQRKVPVMQSAVPVLDVWLNLLDVRRGAMFRRIHKTGKISGEGTTARAVGYVVDRTRRRAGLPPLATHDFRRTFIGDFLDSGGDIVQAQKIAGHVSVTTTAQYDRREDEGLLVAVDRMSLPSPESLRDEPLPHQEESEMS